MRALYNGWVRTSAIQLFIRVLRWLLAFVHNTQEAIDDEFFSNIISVSRCFWPAMPLFPYVNTFEYTCKNSFFFNIRCLFVKSFLYFSHIFYSNYKHTYILLSNGFCWNWIIVYKYMYVLFDIYCNILDCSYITYIPMRTNVHAFNNFVAVLFSSSTYIRYREILTWKYSRNNIYCARLKVGE